MKRELRFGLYLLMISQLFLGCSTIYNQKWKRAAENLEAKDGAAQEGVVGRWEGSWLSSVNNHTGKLRCIVSETESDSYDFHYWARWSLFSGTYHLKVPIQETNSISTFSGTKNLGRLAGGPFDFSGKVEGDHFNARYNSKLDRGKFTMIRVREKE